MVFGRREGGRNGVGLLCAARSCVCVEMGCRVLGLVSQLVGWECCLRWRGCFNGGTQELNG